MDKARRRSVVSPLCATATALLLGLAGGLVCGAAGRAASGQQYPAKFTFLRRPRPGPPSDLLEGPVDATLALVKVQSSLAIPSEVRSCFVILMLWLLGNTLIAIIAMHLLGILN